MLKNKLKVLFKFKFHEIMPLSFYIGKFLLNCSKPDEDFFWTKLQDRHF